MRKNKLIPLSRFIFGINIGTVSTETRQKIELLLASVPGGTVLTSTWLRRQGYSLDLQKRYRRSHWFEPIGTGAMVRTGETVDWLGGVYALQAQLGLAVHPGAGTASALQGRAHYLEPASRREHLFGDRTVRLPKWFLDHDWGVEVVCHKTGFLPPDLDLADMTHKSFDVRVAAPARAMLECLYLAPRHHSLEEAAQLMEGLNNLRPEQAQLLLEACRSVKVKRLFLYLAERAGHDWVTRVDRAKINLGAGKRSLATPGVYVPEYRMTVPPALAPRDG